MKSLALYDHVQKSAGIEETNRLILTERAYNQKHWAAKIEVAVRRARQSKDSKDIAGLVLSVTEEMKQQAKRYMK